MHQCLLILLISRGVCTPRALGIVLTFPRDVLVCREVRQPIHWSCGTHEIEAILIATPGSALTHAWHEAVRTRYLRTQGEVEWYWSWLGRWMCQRRCCHRSGGSAWGQSGESREGDVWKSMASLRVLSSLRAMFHCLVRTLEGCLSGQNFGGHCRMRKWYRLSVECAWDCWN